MMSTGIRNTPHLEKGIEEAMDHSQLADIAKLLRTRRLELGLTLREVGQKLGCSAMSISRLETGERSLKLDELVEYGALLGLTINVEVQEVDRHPELNELLAAARLLRSEHISTLTRMARVITFIPRGMLAGWMMFVESMGEEAVDDQLDCDGPLDFEPANKRRA